ncbi:MAG: hypothetical protein LUE96_05415 [Lachnospiraceae bacterium]|nr:hypothetical protein [Lachnospiraceae bacterium]
MKKKALSLLLASVMTVSLAACGSSSSDSGSTTDSSTSDSNAADSSASADASTEDVDYHDILGDTGITMVVNGTLTATTDNGQAEFKEQWEEAVGYSPEHSAA